MKGKKEICPFCGKAEQVMRDQDKIVIYECVNCKKITAAYLKELLDRLRSFGRWYEVNTFKPSRPRRVRRE